MTDFAPDWTVHPGATLREWRDEQGLDPDPAAARCGLNVTDYLAIEEGTVELNPLMALCLETGTGVSADFWLNYEAKFREGLAAGKAWTP